MIASIIDLARPGPAPLWRRALRMPARRWLLARAGALPIYRPPDAEALKRIEEDLLRLGMPVGSLEIERPGYEAFLARFPFPDAYPGSAEPAIRDEKRLEHYVAWLLATPESPKRQPYLDVAACGSPWVSLLRSRGVAATAIDLDPPPGSAGEAHYEQQDATRMRYESGSIGSASLQCAFEMFHGDQDTRLVVELARVLRPGGRAVILPLYMHTHACHYHTPEYAGRSLGDFGSTAYLRPDCWGIPASRKYDATSLRCRVWDPARAAGLVPSLLVLRNREQVLPGTYLHFVLVLDKPRDAETVS